MPTEEGKSDSVLHISGEIGYREMSVALAEKARAGLTGGSEEPERKSGRREGR